MRTDENTLNRVLKINQVLSYLQRDYGIDTNVATTPLNLAHYTIISQGVSLGHRNEDIAAEVAKVLGYTPKEACPISPHPQPPLTFKRIQSLLTDQHIVHVQQSEGSDEGLKLIFASGDILEFGYSAQEGSTYYCEQPYAGASLDQYQRTIVSFDL